MGWVESFEKQPCQNFGGSPSVASWLQARCWGRVAKNRRGKPAMILRRRRFSQNSYTHQTGSPATIDSKLQAFYGFKLRTPDHITPPRNCLHEDPKSSHQSLFHPVLHLESYSLRPKPSTEQYTLPSHSPADEEAACRSAELAQKPCLTRQRSIFMIFSAFQGPT